MACKAASCWERRPLRCEAFLCYTFVHKGCPESTQMCRMENRSSYGWILSRQSSCTFIRT